MLSKLLLILLLYIPLNLKSMLSLKQMLSNVVNYISKFEGKIIEKSLNLPKKENIVGRFQNFSPNKYNINYEKINFSFSDSLYKEGGLIENLRYIPTTKSIRKNKNKIDYSFQSFFMPSAYSKSLRLDRLMKDQLGGTEEEYIVLESSIEIINENKKKIIDFENEVYHTEGTVFSNEDKKRKERNELYNNFHEYNKNLIENIDMAIEKKKNESFQFDEINKTLYPRDSRIISKISELEEEVICLYQVKEDIESFNKIFNIGFSTINEWARENLNMIFLIFKTKDINLLEDINKNVDLKFKFETFFSMTHEGQTKSIFKMDRNKYFKKIILKYYTKYDQLEIKDQIRLKEQRELEKQEEQKQKELEEQLEEQEQPKKQEQLEEQEKQEVQEVQKVQEVQEEPEEPEEPEQTEEPEEPEQTEEPEEPEERID